MHKWGFLSTYNCNNPIYGKNKTNCNRSIIFMVSIKLPLKLEATITVTPTPFFYFHVAQRHGEWHGLCGSQGIALVVLLLSWDQLKGAKELSSMDWFVGENLHRKPWYLPSNMTGFPVKFPIIQFYDFNMKKQSVRMDEIVLLDSSYVDEQSATKLTINIVTCFLRWIR